MGYCKTKYELNDKVKNLVPYDAVTGSYEIRLDANESFVDLGELLRAEIAEAVAAVPLNRYPDAKATLLRQKFGAFYGVDPEAVVAGNGSDELISIIFAAFLKQGDKILLLDPDFSMYQFYGQIYERSCRVVEKPRDLCINGQRISQEIADFNPEVVLFSNPCSPTSKVISREEIIDILDNTNALIIVDEAYMDFSDQSVLDLTSEYDNLIVLKTCSKALGLAALRLGFGISGEKIVRALNSIRSPYNINGISQAIGAVVLSHPDVLKEGLERIIVSREELYQGLLKLEKFKGVKNILKPETNFVFMEVADAGYLYNELLKASIIVRRLGNYLRITAGTKEENERVVEALAGIFEKKEGTEKS